MFLRKKYNVWFFVLFACGLYFIGLYIFFNITDPDATGESPTFLIAGIFIILVAISSLLLNFGAFIRIEEDSIKAKYNWFGKIDCKLSDVVFAAARVNTLIIQLKDGKTHTITGVENSWPLAVMIRRNMAFEISERPEVIMEKLNELKSEKKKELIYVCSGLALMFINIFITVFLTGERELQEFGKIDWIIFAVMGVIEIATLIAVFYFAGKTGKNNITIEKLQYTLRRRIIETQPLLPGSVIAVYTDENYTGRITLFGYPYNNSVYYSVQEFDSDYTLFKAYTSYVYGSQDGLPANFEALIDITDKVLH